MPGSPVPENHVIVIFGANGDLAGRKLVPGLFHLAADGLMPADYRIVGSSREDLSDDDFRAFARAAVEKAGRVEPDERTWEAFAERLSYVPGEFGPGRTGRLADAVAAAEARLGDVARRLAYLAIPPTAFAAVTEGLGESGLAAGARVVYEKPFGLGLESFRELNAAVRRVLHESQVYRIDHFLGKESVQNILAIRFANGMYEPVWNRDHIDHVQVDVPEALGIGARAGFYERVGALRDMVVTHLFQVLSFVAMEPPSALSARALTEEKLKVFEAMSPLRPEDLVRGQYEGYRELDGVARDTTTETFVAARVHVDNWRWAGVPFYLRTGKRLAESRSAVTLAFREPPRHLFRSVPADRLETNHLTFSLGPWEGVSISFHAKVPGPALELGPARMDYRFGSSPGPKTIDAYERLLHDAMCGDRTLFTRGDGVERVWEVVEPVLADPPPPHPYEQGSWGPAAASRLIAPRRWHLPDPDEPGA
ncbi:MAG TPA: glucose-6-phosphate dehydrogenase [Actinomycetota bacterium]|nr:glucose-6-phosphate dehydrogenase [Actinomycetota bacterium]